MTGDEPLARRRRSSPARVVILGSAAMVALTAAALLTEAGQPPADAVARDPGVTAKAEPALAASWQRPVVSTSGLASRVGVQVTQVAVSGGGGLLDLRVLVVDADRAAALHDRATPPAIVDEATGVVARELLMGHEHSDPFDAGITYAYIFTNPGNVIQRGGTVSVLLGDVQIDDLEVR